MADADPKSEDNVNILKGPFLSPNDTSTFIYKLNGYRLPSNLFSIHIQAGRGLSPDAEQRLARLFKLAPDMLELLERVVDSADVELPIHMGDYLIAAEARSLILKIKE